MDAGSTKKVQGLTGVHTLEDLTKAFEAGKLSDNPEVERRAALAIAEQRAKDEFKSAVTPVKGNERIYKGPSKIPGFERGLFVANDTSAWQEVSRTRPLVAVVYEGHEDDVCDWCFANSIYPMDFKQDENEPQKKVMKRCSGCKVCGYCSKECQEKAWNMYHKAECKTYKSSVYKAVPPDFVNGNTRTLTRLLCMYKMGTLTEVELGEILELPHNAAELFKNVQIRPNFTIDSQASLRKRSQHSIDATKSTLTSAQAYNLLSFVLSQTMILSDDSLATLGQGVDLLCASLNHSCEPNTFYFVDQGEVRMRVTKPLKAGEQLTTGYVYEPGGVEARRKKLERQYGFKCECPKCLRELFKVRTATPEQTTQREKFFEAQKQLSSLTTFNAVKLSELAKDIKKFENEIETITRAACPDGDWPSDVEPMPSINMMITYGHLANGQFLEALKYAFRGLLNCQLPRQVSRERVQGLVTFFMLVDKFLVPLTRGLPEGCPLTVLDVVVVYHGYCRALVHILETMFYAETKVATAFKTRLKDFETRVLPSDFPERSGQEYRKLFLFCEKNVLDWAGVPKKKGIKLLKA